MSKSTILLLGNCVIDDIYELADYPTEDDEQRALSHRRQLGGNACNSAQILAELGQPVSLVATLADDEPAQWALQQLQRLGIDSANCPQLRHAVSPHSVIWVNRNNASRTIVHHRELAELSLEHLRALPFERYAHVHCEGRNIEVLAQLLPNLPKIKISLEIEKPRDGIEALARYCDTLVVSQQYLRQRQMSPSECFTELRRCNPQARIVCTLGADGLHACDSDGQHITLAAAKVGQVVDSVGAGDCFIAGLIYRLTHGADFTNALEFANHLAAQKIQHQGMTLNDHI